MPTEAEWEYAARAGTTTSFYSGDISPRQEGDAQCTLDEALSAIGWHCGNSEQRSHEVGDKTPSGWGLFDTAGNVTEWCNDAYDDVGYGQGPLVDPVAWNEGVAERIVVRGGDFFHSMHNCIAGHRGSAIPDTADPTIGFRLVRSEP